MIFFLFGQKNNTVRKKDGGFLRTPTDQKNHMRKLLTILTLLYSEAEIANCMCLVTELLF